MMRILMLFCGLALGLSLAAPARAQGAPTQIDAALLDLSARLGQSISLGDLSNWRWEQKQFADSALGCATASGSGSSALGYRFELTYSGVAYDYRVSADAGVVIFCGEVTGDASSAAAKSQYSNRLCGDSATDGPYMRSSVIYGIEAEVIQGFLNLRGQPSTSGQTLLQIPAGQRFDISAGPDCAEGFVWWLVNVSGQTGYVAEAGDGAVFLRPRAPVPLPSREILNTRLAQWLQELSRVEGNFLEQHAWSSDGARLALPGARGSDSIWLYDLRDQSLRPQLLAFDEGLSTLLFRPNRPQILFGSESGALHLWQLRPRRRIAFCRAALPKCARWARLGPRLQRRWRSLRQRRGGSVFSPGGRAKMGGDHLGHGDGRAASLALGPSRLDSRSRLQPGRRYAGDRRRRRHTEILGRGQRRQSGQARIGGGSRRD